MKFLSLRCATARPTLVLCAALLAAVFPTASRAAAAPKAAPDLLVFSNGDKLTGTLDHEADGTVFFKSENAGMVQVAWSKLKELHTAAPFAVIENGAPVARKSQNLDVPVGVVFVNGDMLTVTTAKGPQQIPVSSIAYLVDEPTFNKNVRQRQKFFQGITGTATAGASTVNSTQNSESVNTSVVLARAVPAVDWMPPRERTLLNFSNTYGRITEPNVPTVKTNILHGGLEEHEYFSPRFYLLQQAMFDHNFSQGLDLQQLYGIGIGYTVTKSAVQQLDVTAAVDYTKQQFAGSATTPATSQNIIGSNYGDNYMRKLPKKIVFTEVGSITPAWNTPKDYSANIAVGATMALYKNFGFSVGAIDSYLNDPPAGFKSNSVQFNTGLTYSIQ